LIKCQGEKLIYTLIYIYIDVNAILMYLVFMINVLVFIIITIGNIILDIIIIIIYELLFTSPKVFSLKKSIIKYFMT